MPYEFLMNTASALYFVCYIPELYANYKNQNVNMYNMPEKGVLLVATSLALTYAILIEDTSLIANYAPLLGLDVIAFGMRLYYVYRLAPKVDVLPSESCLAPKVDVLPAELRLAPKVDVLPSECA